MIHGKSIKGWLIFFYSVPSKPVSNRMRIWRRLSKIGAIQLKGAIYILPYNEETYESCQWLSSEVSSMRGEGSFVRVEKIETIKDNEIIELFNQQRGKDYRNIEKRLDETERKINSVKKGTRTEDYKRLSDQINKLLKDFEETKKIDFFSSKFGLELEKRIRTMEAEFKSISGANMKKQTTSVVRKKIEDYQKKIWVTRKRPFVDRMASAWLIKRFIDKKASFDFINDKNIGKLNKDTVAFDIRDGEFTHIGDMCTFEVILKSFGLKNKTLTKISEIVHELDINDDRFKNLESKGLEEILSGIRKMAKIDADGLERGMAVFDMLYESKT